MVLVVTVLSTIKGPWQTRTRCCGHIVANTNVSLFARTCNICCGHKFCVQHTKNVSDFVLRNILCPQQMFPSLRNMETQHSFSFVSRCAFARPRNIMRNNVSLFARALMHRTVSVGNDNFSLFTGHIISWRGLGDRGGGGGKNVFDAKDPLET